MTGTQREWVVGLLLAIIIVLVYLPAMHGGFIWDDDDHLTHNAVVVGPLGLKEIWTTSAARICPLTLSCFWLQHAFWGLHPMPYHIVNILMHAISAVLLWRILIRLRVPGAWFGALFWALHPVQVESVAWITELKNTQSCVFYLLTIVFFLKWMDIDSAISQRRRERDYVLAVVFAALAMASKSSTVILPVVLGLCGWCVRRRWDWQSIYRLIPFFVLAALASGVSVWTVEIERAGDQQWIRTWPEKLAVAGNIVWFYFGKLLWPQPLVFIYPRWEVDAAQVSSFIGSLCVCGVFLFLWWNRQSRLRLVFFAFAYFLVALLPVMGLVDHYFLRYSFVGDHFQYLASMGVIALVVACGATLFGYAGGRGKWVGGAIGVLFAIVLGSQTWRYERVFADNESLWRDTITKNPSAWIAHNNLGNILASHGQFGEAIDHYKDSLKLNPGNAQSHNNMGVALMAIGQPLLAIEHYTEAMGLNPSYSDAELNLKVARAALSNRAEAEGSRLASQGQSAEAIGCYSDAIRWNPDNVNAHNNLGSFLLALGRPEAAAMEFMNSIRLNPNIADTQFNLGIALSSLGKYEEAIAPYSEALRLSPEDAEVHHRFGIALTYCGKHAEAILHFTEALRLRPDFAEAHNNLGVLFAQQDRRDEAESHFLEALRLKPDHTDAQANLERIRSP